MQFQNAVYLLMIFSLFMLLITFVFWLFLRGKPNYSRPAQGGPLNQPVLPSTKRKIKIGIAPIRIEVRKADDPQISKAISDCALALVEGRITTPVFMRIIDHNDNGAAKDSLIKLRNGVPILHRLKKGHAPSREPDILIEIRKNFFIQHDIVKQEAQKAERKRLELASWEKEMHPVEIAPDHVFEEGDMLDPFEEGGEYAAQFERVTKSTLGVSDVETATGHGAGGPNCGPGRSYFAEDAGHGAGGYSIEQTSSPFDFLSVLKGTGSSSEASAPTESGPSYSDSGDSWSSNSNDSSSSDNSTSTGEY